jgi:DNA uptake protein ComE-like DNA-binding protein
MKNTLAFTQIAFLFFLIGTLAYSQTPMTKADRVLPIPTQENDSHMKNGELDINKATSEELAALGLSDGAILKILKFRPFHKRHDLYTHKILSLSDYEKIRDKIFAWTPSRAMVTR